MTVPMSSGNTDRQLQFMEDLGVTALCCTPSYAEYLGEVVEEQGRRKNLKLRAGFFGAEAWSEEMRRDIEAKLGLKAYDIYGLTELSGPGVAYECAEQTGMHINEDHFIAETIDPETARCCRRAARASWCSPRSTKKPSRCCATARTTSAC
jgi:phenylacetate-CoA ligase